MESTGAASCEESCVEEKGHIHSVCCSPDKQTTPHTENMQQPMQTPYYGYDYYAGPHSNTSGALPQSSTMCYAPPVGSEYTPAPYMLRDGSVIYPSPVKLYPENAYMHPGYDYTADPTVFCGPGSVYGSYHPSAASTPGFPVPPPHISYRNPYDQQSPAEYHSQGTDNKGKPRTPGVAIKEGISPQVSFPGVGVDGSTGNGRCMPNGFDYYADDVHLFRDYNYSVQNNTHNGSHSGVASGAGAGSGAGLGVSNYFNSLLYGPGPPIITNAQPARIKGPPGSNLFCFHLPNEITNWDLYLLFRRFGTILSVHTMVNRQSGLSRGYGFISYEDSASAERAIEYMDGFRLGKKRLKVQRKRDQQGRSDGKEKQLELEQEADDTGYDTEDSEPVSTGADLDMDLLPTQTQAPVTPAAPTATAATSVPVPVPIHLTRRNPCNQLPSPSQTDKAAGA